ncbi:MAG: hydroxymethylbilane synthase [Flavobacterium sp.]|jgi:hydroxymethylbilane synthase
MIDHIRLATRESALAMWQANYVKSQLEQAHSNLRVEIIGMTTAGDRDKRSPLSQMGGKGVFIKELEVALYEGRADIAVHSMKDVPSLIPDGLHLSAICEREDPRDAFVSCHFNSLMELPPGSKIGSSSLRRRLQLKLARPDLVYEELRGNVGTRLAKLDEGKFDGIILATAGLIRLQLKDRVTQEIDPTLCIPSAGQGAVGIESRTDNQELNELLGAINHRDTYDCVMCEREISSGLGADCSLPIAAFALLSGEDIKLNAYVSDREGRRHISLSRSGLRDDGIAIAKKLVEALYIAGAGELIGENI